VSNYHVGHKAEKDAAEYLISHGYSIRGMNWKTRYCEIDIVAEKDRTMYFVEVKYRKNNLQGSGFDYITSKKLQQMSFAAEMWVQQNRWDGPYQLSGLSIDGESFTFVDCID